jgi:hypothetical protein
MTRRLALVVALAVTVVVGFALLAVATGGLGSGETNTSGGDAAPAATDVATTEQPTQSSDPPVTSLPSSEGSDNDRRESAREDYAGGEHHEGSEHERLDEDRH